MPGPARARRGRPRADRRLRRQHGRPARRRRTRSASRASSGRPRTARSCSRRWRSSSGCCPRWPRAAGAACVAIGSMAVSEPIDALQLSNAHRPGLVAAFKVLARRFAADGVTLNFVHPGRIATDRVIGTAGSLEAAEEPPATRSRPAASARPRSSPPPSSSSAPRRRPTSRARACSSTAALTRSVSCSTPRGNRTPATAVKGPRANRYTMGARRQMVEALRPTATRPASGRARRSTRRAASSSSRSSRPVAMKYAIIATTAMAPERGR